VSKCQHKGGTETQKEGDYYVTYCSDCGAEIKRVHSGENT